MLLLYDNLFAKTTIAGYAISASTSATGYPVENIADWLDFDFWKANASGVSYVEVQFTSAQSADTLALYGHDLFTNSASVKVKRYDSGAWTQVGATLTPTSDGLQVLQFTSASDTRWRIEVTSTPASTIAIGFLGVALVLPAAQIGFSPPLVLSDDTTTNRAAGGSLLGVFGKPKSSDLRISMELRTPAWIRSYWVPFMQHARRRAFILCWDETTLGESWFCWCEKDLQNAEYTHPTFMKAALNCKATDGL